MSAYLCGYCGQPCDSNGVPLQAPANESYENATLVHGECCLSDVTEEEQQRVSHEMAMDAGDLSLEGSQV